jgi:hypothetical protein
VEEGGGERRGQGAGRGEGVEGFADYLLRGLVFFFWLLVVGGESVRWSTTSRRPCRWRVHSWGRGWIARERRL